MRKRGGAKDGDRSTGRIGGGHGRTRRPGPSVIWAAQARGTSTWELVNKQRTNAWSVMSNRLAEPMHPRCLDIQLEASNTILAQACVALVFSDWTTALTVTTPRTPRWPNTLPSIETRTPGLGIYRHGSRMGWNVCLTQPSHTLQHGLGFYWDGVLTSTTRPKKSESVPRILRHKSSICNLTEHLIAERPEHVMPEVGLG
jgi:hypothetical protein